MPAKKQPTKRSKKRAPPARGARKPKKASLAGALAAAAWADADDALAEALVELDEFQDAQDDAARETALALLVQALARAARKRGLTRIGELGGREPFDPARHDFQASAKKPKTVRITARGVARGAEVLRRPRAGPVRRRRAR